ncbi:hypothetical protein ACBQ54_18215 [Providencia vermicola]|uniref:hypothetical protein n=1 Tax=Providencia vermicola TaxID=333965 RepID=UPI002AB4119B|nr:hypothetical protein [Providencia stuartii]
MKKYQKIRSSRLFQVNEHGFLSESSAVVNILANIKQYFPAITQLIWSSYRADNEIHELVIAHPLGRFVLTMESGFGPTIFPRISQEDWDLQHKQVEFVDGVDIFHFICQLLHEYQLDLVTRQNNGLYFQSTN